MAMKWKTRIGIGAAAAALLTLGVAAPALADHNAGADLDGGTGCYYGALLWGPPEDLRTDTYRVIERGGSLTVVCSFTTKPFYPASEVDDEWFAPARPVVRYFGSGDPGASCVPPGVDSASETWLDAPDTSAPHADSVVVAFYRTSMVLTCHWRVAPHP
jgi:hypothetical protein